MADEKTRDQNQGNDQDRGKAMGAGASAGYQGQQGPQNQQNPGNNPQQSETAGQGGGIQGSGQRQTNPGGYTDSKGGPGAQNAQRDDQRNNQSSAEGREQSQGE